STGYDSYGNIVAESNELGTTTSFVVDPTFHQYLTQKTNALGQSATVEWDPVCAAKTTATDPNGQKVTMHYDALCSPTRTDLPLGAFEIRSNVNLGDPNRQYVQVEVPGADGSGNLWERRYLDGLGRTYRTVRKGPVADSTCTQARSCVYHDTSFNPREQVASETAPYFSGDT